MTKDYLTPVLNEVSAERVYQDNKWGTKSDDENNSPWHWVAYITKYATGWMRGEWNFSKDTTGAFRTAMIKVAAIAVAAVESLDRQRDKQGSAFYED